MLLLLLVARLLARGFVRRVAAPHKWQHTAAALKGLVQLREGICKKKKKLTPGNNISHVTVKDYSVIEFTGALRRTGAHNWRTCMAFGWQKCDRVFGWENFFFSNNFLGVFFIDTL